MIYISKSIYILLALIPRNYYHVKHVKQADSSIPADGVRRASAGSWDEIVGWLIFGGYTNLEPDV